MNYVSNRRRLASLAMLLGAALATTALAADHRETPLTTSDAIADIADVYTWHQDGRFVVVVTVDGIRMPTPGQTARFDGDVTYQINIGRDDFPTTQQSAVDVTLRVKSDGEGGWRVSARDVPGSNGNISGPVETVLTKGSANLFVGLRDDPFFFDLEGFRNTVATGSLMFVATRDTFAGTNATAIVLEMDLEAVRAGSQNLYVWATTSRKDG
jgi:hypothetical protein